MNAGIDLASLFKKAPQKAEQLKALEQTKALEQLPKEQNTLDRVSGGLKTVAGLGGVFGLLQNFGYEGIKNAAGAGIKPAVDLYDTLDRVAGVVGKKPANPTEFDKQEAEREKRWQEVSNAYLAREASDKATKELHQQGFELPTWTGNLQQNLVRTPMFLAKMPVHAAYLMNEADKFTNTLVDEIGNKITGNTDPSKNVATYGKPFADVHQKAIDTAYKNADTADYWGQNQLFNKIGGVGQERLDKMGSIANYLSPEVKQDILQGNVPTTYSLEDEYRKANQQYGLEQGARPFMQQQVEQGKLLPEVIPAIEKGLSGGHEMQKFAVDMLADPLMLASDIAKGGQFLTKEVGKLLTNKGEMKAAEAMKDIAQNLPAKGLSQTPIPENVIPQSVTPQNVTPQIPQTQLPQNPKLKALRQELQNLQRQNKQFDAGQIPPELQPMIDKLAQSETRLPQKRLEAPTQQPISEVPNELQQAIPLPPASNVAQNPELQDKVKQLLQKKGAIPGETIPSEAVSTNMPVEQPSKIEDIFDEALRQHLGEPPKAVEASRISETPKVSEAPQVQAPQINETPKVQEQLPIVPELGKSLEGANIKELPRQYTPEELQDYNHRGNALMQDMGDEYGNRVGDLGEDANIIRNANLPNIQEVKTDKPPYTKLVAGIGPAKPRDIQFPSAFHKYMFELGTPYQEATAKAAGKSWEDYKKISANMKSTLFEPLAELWYGKSDPETVKKLIDSASHYHNSVNKALRGTKDKFVDLNVNRVESSGEKKLRDLLDDIHNTRSNGEDLKKNQITRESKGAVLERPQVTQPNTSEPQQFFSDLESPEAKQALGELQFDYQKQLQKLKNQGYSPQDADALIHSQRIMREIPGSSGKAAIPGRAVVGSEGGGILPVHEKGHLAFDEVLRSMASSMGKHPNDVYEDLNKQLLSKLSRDELEELGNKYADLGYNKQDILHELVAGVEEAKAAHKNPRLRNQLSGEISNDMYNVLGQDRYKGTREHDLLKTLSTEVDKYLADINPYTKVLKEAGSTENMNKVLEDLYGRKLPKETQPYFEGGLRDISQERKRPSPFYESNQPVENLIAEGLTPKMQNKVDFLEGILHKGENTPSIFDSIANVHGDNPKMLNNQTMYEGISNILQPDHPVNRESILEGLMSGRLNPETSVLPDIAGKYNALYEHPSNPYYGDIEKIIRGNNPDLRLSEFNTPEAEQSLLDRLSLLEQPNEGMMTESGISRGNVSDLERILEAIFKQKRGLPPKKYRDLEF